MCSDKNNPDVTKGIDQEPDSIPSTEQVKKAFEINEKLGRGINMGNAFEAPSENEWGNPWKPEYFGIMAELGFSHVRVPVRWETRTSNTLPYTIDETFLKRIKTVVDEALKNKLYVIINMHHHDALIADPVGQKARFLAQWKQISDYFKDYSNLLLFEILNEPNGEITTNIWNQLLSEALEVIREENPSRIVLVGTAEYGGISGLNQLKVPEEDGNIIVTVHYYNPFQFTHQGADWAGDGDGKWLGTKWNDTDIEREAIHQDFQLVKDFSQKYNVPIHVGEFGAYNKADIKSRERWTTYLARWLEDQGFSWAYWEFSAGFGIYDPNKKELIDPLVNALLHNSIPEPGAIKRTPAYTSDFSTGNNGWKLQQGGGTGSLERKNGELSIDIKDGGNNSWNLQLIKEGITLKKGKEYEMVFTISSSDDRSFSSYIGMNSEPWSAYSGYKSFSTGENKQKVSHVFKMNENDVNSARIVFDLGGKEPCKFILSNFTLNEIEVIPNE
jgi:aryl-phospho-beta-D-glucosidase BglC (GH1 family)